MVNAGRWWAIPIAALVPLLPVRAAETAPKPPSPAELARFVADLRPAAEARGVAAATFEAAFAGLTPDPAVADLLVPVLLVAAVLQPVAGVVFVLDGVLIGAGDGRYLAVAGLVAEGRRQDVRGIYATVERALTRMRADPPPAD